jgi:predicted nucleic acid-binding protein
MPLAPCSTRLTKLREIPDQGLPRTCAQLRAVAVRLGHPLGHRANANDLWIAACAVHHGLPLVTGNPRHFAGLPGLTVLTPDRVR